MPTDATQPALPPPTASSSTAPSVTAVLVSHDGAAWLPAALAALAGQTRPPDDVVAVDTASVDASRDLLVAALGADRVLDAHPTSGFGAAVAMALAPALRRPPAGVLPDPTSPREWLWLLHDDVAPQPRALEELLAEVTRDPEVAIAGPKIRGWYDRRLLLEVGVTIARNGRRETLLERREQDQGQHDGTRQVLAVSTAGMLVRRDVWDALDGLDPALPLLRDDVDLGWRATLAGYKVICVTAAVAHHAEAAAHGRRAIAVRAGGAGGPRGGGGARGADGELAPAHRLDREHAIRVLLLNLPFAELPVAVLRLAFGTLVRSVGLFLGKLPGRALGEILALLAVVGRPGRLVAGRRARRRTRRTTPRAAHRLLAPRGSGWRHLMETVNLLVGPGPAAAAGGAHRAVETGPSPDEVEDLPNWGNSLVRRVASRPGVLLVGVLAVLALLSCRGLYGGGRLMGGALLPAPDSAGDLWRTYTEAWHPVGIGSDTISPPYLAVLAGLATVLAGHASLAVDLLLVGAVPLAGLSAYLAARHVVRSLPLRLWGAATYALLPPVVGAVAAGRLSTVVVALLLPVTVLCAARAAGDRGAPGSTRAAWGAGLLLAVMTAFAPAVYLLALVLLSAAAVAFTRGRDSLRLAMVAGVPPVLLLPWLPAVVAHPSLLLLEAGFPGPGLSTDRPDPLGVFLLHPGGPGSYPAIVSVGLLLAGLVALLRRDRRWLVLAAWAVTLVGLAAALVQSRVRVSAASLETAVPAWPGPALLVAATGLLVAAATGATGARTRLTGASFGWRQPASVALAVLAAAVPVLAAGWWLVTGAAGPLERRDPVLLPAFIAAEGARPAQPRTLVLRPRPAHRLAYALLRADGPRLGDAETTTLADPATGLGRAVADLASGRGGDAAAGVLPYGVRYVLMTSPLDPGLSRDVDAVPGLVRVSGPEGSLVWKVQYPSGRVRVLARRAGGPGADASARVVGSGPVGARSTVPAGAGGRVLVLADRKDGGWRATIDGRALQATTYDGWAQAFRLPAAGGALRLRHDPGLRPALLWTQALALALVVILVLPSARTEGETADRTDDAATGATAPPAGPTAFAPAGAGDDGGRS